MSVDLAKRERVKAALTTQRGGGEEITDETRLDYMGAVDLAMIFAMHTSISVIVPRTKGLTLGELFEHNGI